MAVSTRLCIASPRISLSLIRDFALRREDELIDLPVNGQRLVCFLALQDGPVRRSYVSGTLWCNSDERRASASLRSALWRLPSGFELVDSSNTHIWLAKAVTVDIREVIQRGLSVLTEQHSEAELVELARQLVAVGDEVLVGWYDDWVITQRERFRQIRLHALDRIAELLVVQGRLCEAMQVALAAVQAEPLRESAHRVLIRVHLREGNIAEAVRQYRVYARLLDRELNATPSPMIRRLLTPYVPQP